MVQIKPDGGGVQTVIFHCLSPHSNREASGLVHVRGTRCLRVVHEMGRSDATVPGQTGKGGGGKESGREEAASPQESG
jgi:hypothetical protein